VVLAIFGFFIRIMLHQEVGEALTLTLVQEPLGFLLSGLIYVLYRRFSIADPFRIETAAWMVVLSLAAAFVQTSVAHWATEIFELHYPGWTPREQWLFRMTFIWLLYMVWSLTLFTLRSKLLALKASERAHLALEEKQRMELQLLRSQLDPHFLFNSLNSVAAEIKPHPEAAVEMVRELSDYLRYSLENRHQMITPLAHELDAVAAYLKIEKARFGERVQAEVKADDAARQRPIPSFLLQPLVENAVKHGLHQSETPWQLEILAGTRDTLLSIEVKNSGALDPATPAQEGVGLETLHRRLDLHYPNRHHFELTQQNGSVVAQLQLEGEPCQV